MCQVSYHLSRVYLNGLVGPLQQLYPQRSPHALGLMTSLLLPARNRELAYNCTTYFFGEHAVDKLAG